jgi:hypothetical protein
MIYRSFGSRARRSIVFTFLVFACAALSLSANAGVVTNTNDSGPGSLRQAIADAAAGETITFAAGVTGTITLTSGALEIDKDLTIQGPGAALLTISSSNNRVDVIEIVASIVTNISGLTIADGRFGIFGGDRITLLSNLVITRNKWGGIATASNMTVSDSTISDNGDSGIFAELNSVTIQRCTITHNRSTGGGGGIHLHNENAVVTNCTIADNSANTTNFGGQGGQGGGIEIYDSYSVKIASCSIVNNSASVAGGGISVALPNAGGPVLQNTIVARNHDVNQNPSDIDPSVPVRGTSSYNLIGTGGAGGLMNGVNHNQVGIANPGLGPLGDNGGSTQTVPLLPNSPALDAGNSFGLTTDQRGYVRPVDIPRIPNAGDGSDVGAFEAQGFASPTPTPTATATATATFTPTPTATATFTPTPTPTATFTPTTTATATATFTPTPTATATFTPTPTATATFTPTPTPTPTPTAPSTWVLGQWYQGPSGHYYSVQAISGPDNSWFIARAQARALVASNGRPADLATLTSAEENDFVFAGIDDPTYWAIDGANNNEGPDLGGFQFDKLNEPAGDWAWVTGESWSYTNWASGEPDNSNGVEDFLNFFALGNARAATWNDISGAGGSEIHYYIAESTDQQPCTPPPADLVSWWPGDGNADDIQGGNNGTLQGGATFAPGLINDAFSFNGVDAYIDIPHNDNLNPSGPFSLDVWVQADPSQSYPQVLIIDKSHGFTDSTGWAIQTNTDGTACFLYGLGGSGTSNFIGACTQTSILDGQWHHLAGVWTGTVIQIYEDAVPQNTVNSTAMPVNNNRDVHICMAWGGGTPTRFFDGLVDEADFFNRALSPQEVQSIFVAGSSGKCQPSGPWVLGQWYQGPSGHYYSVQQITGGDNSWPTARNQAQALVAPNGQPVNLATLTSAEENNFVFSGINDPAYWAVDDGNHNEGPYIGGYQFDKLHEPDGDWTWVTGEPWSYTNWAPGEPSNSGGNEDYLTFFSVDGVSRTSTWNDDDLSTVIHYYVAESEDCIPAPPDLISWWPGDGNALDVQGGNNGTLENGATLAAGLVNQAFSFNRAMTQFVQVPDAADIRFGGNLPMSVDFWIYRTDPSQTQHFIGKRVTCDGDGNGTFQMGLDFVVTGGCGVFFGQPDVPGNTVCSGVDLPMNVWTHLAGTFDGSTISLYMNGQLIGQQTGASLGPSNTQPLLIGGTTQTGPCGQQTTGGLIDEVDIFDRALSEQEVQSIFAAGSFGKCQP